MPDFANIGAVILDLDGTLIQGNSFHRWLLFVIMGGIRQLSYKNRILLVYDCLGRLFRMYSHSEMKRRTLARIYSLHTEDDICRFVDLWLVPICSKVCINALIDWRHKGAYLVLATAAPDIYAEEIGRRFGFDKVVSSKWTPLKAFEECKCEEKMRRVCISIGSLEILAMYSDNDNDIPLLKIAKKAYLVNSSDKNAKKVLKAIGPKRLILLEG